VRTRDIQYGSVGQRRAEVERVVIQPSVCASRSQDPQHDAVDGVLVDDLSDGLERVG